MIFPFGAPFRLPNDDLGHQMSAALFENEELRNRLTNGMYIPPHSEEGLGYLEATVESMNACEPLVAKIKLATQKKILNRHHHAPFQEALEKNIISASEKLKLEAMEAMKHQAIQVDEFPQEYFKI